MVILLGPISNLIACIRSTRNIFEKANKYYEDAFRLNVAKVVSQKSQLVHGDSW